MSLFTDVPKTLAVEVCCAQLKEDCILESRTCLTIYDIMLMFRLCLNQTHYAFDDAFYHKADGCPMSSLISVTAANLVMEYVEQLTLESAPFLVKFYRRNVDDIVVTLDRQNVDSFHKLLNHIHPTIKFTRKIEINGMLGFLDVGVIHRPSGRLDSTVFCKECDKGILLKFNSHHPAAHTRSVVPIFIERADTLPSTYELRANEYERLSVSLRGSNYPERCVTKTRTKVMQKKHSGLSSVSRARLCIPYVHGVS